MADLVLTPQEFRILDGLRLNPRKSFSGRIRGERLTKKKGVSIEFDDYREYSEGDDLRHLDWNVFARLDHSVIKTYRDEEDLAVHILLDGSASMLFGDPTKFRFAQRLACAIGYVALCGGDAVYPHLIGERVEKCPAIMGRSNFPRLATWITNQTASGKRVLSQELRAFAASGARPGLAYIVTDAMDPEIFTAIRIIKGRGHEVCILQTLSEIELRPDLEGDLRLLDIESNAHVEITASGITLREYANKLHEHNKMLEEECLRAGGRYALVEVSSPLNIFVMDVLKKGGWIVK